MPGIPGRGGQPGRSGGKRAGSGPPQVRFRLSREAARRLRSIAQASGESVEQTLERLVLAAPVKEK